MARISRVDTILNLTPDQLMAMSRKDLAKNISTLASAANKRLKRLEISGEFSPAAEYVKTHGGKFSVAGKSKNQLLIEFFRVQQFMESKTSTVGGAKRWQRNVEKEVSKSLKTQYNATGSGAKSIEKAVKEIFSDPKKREQFWDLYSRIVAEYDVKTVYKEIWDDIANAMTATTTQSTDDLFETITKSYEEQYQIIAPQDEGDELLLTSDVKKSIKELATGKVL